MFDVDDVLFVALDLMARRNGAVLIDDDVAKSAALVDDAVAKDDGTGDLGAFLDLDATADESLTVPSMTQPMEMKLLVTSLSVP